MPGTFSRTVAVLFRADTRQLETGLSRARVRFQHLWDFTRRFRAGLLGMNAALTGTGATLALAGIGVRHAVRSFEQYSDAQADLRRIMSFSNVPMRMQADLLSASDAAARRFGYGLAESAAGMNTLYETGLNAHQVMRYHPIVAEFARGANMELNEAARTLIPSMRMFRLEGEAGARMLAASLSVAAASTNTEVRELNVAFGHSRTELSSMGFEATDVIATLGGLSQIGMTGSKAGYRLRSAMVALHRITPTTSRMIQGMGYNVEDLRDALYNADGSLRPMVESSRTLTEWFQRIRTAQERNTIAMQLFGRHGWAGGVILAGLHERSADFLQTAERLSDQELTLSQYTNSVNERMQGFAQQMRLAKLGAEELGISFMESLFGPMEGTSQGFGRYISDLALATRVAVNHGHAVGQTAEDYDNLSQSVRDTGTEVSGFYATVRDLGRGFVDVWRFFQPVIHGHERVAAWTIVISAMTHRLWIPLGRIIGQAALGLGRMSFSLANFSRLSSFLSRSSITSAMGGRVMGAGALIIDIGGRVSMILTDWFTAATGTRDALLEMDRWAPRWISYFPVIGAWFVQVARILISGVRAWTEMFGVFTRHASFRRGTVDLTAEERLLQRSRQLEASVAGYRGEENRPARESAALRGESSRALALLIARTRRAHPIDWTLSGFGGGRGGQMQEVEQALRAAGVQGRELADFMPQVSAALRDYGSEMSYARAVNESGAVSLRDAAESMAELIRVAQLAQAVERGGTTGGATTGPGVAHDAYISSSGFLPFPVAAGDVLLNRRELAGAMIGGPGSLVGAPSQVVSGTPQGASGSSTVEANLTIEIPLTIDGREVARAVGSHVLQIDQRRGARIRPGSRRSVVEQGVQR